MSYWPVRDEDHLFGCIRTEAEELSEHVLLAVHEPMQLVRDGVEGRFPASEHDLLKELLGKERPLPVIGPSGVGKSHLIRWLDAQLRLLPECKDWQIVRIPKNASLRQVLELLLKDLEGEAFDQARAQIRNVGRRTSAQDVAEYLLTHMRNELRHLHQKAHAEMVALRTASRFPDKELEARFELLEIHATERGLPALLSDPNYKSTWLVKDSAVFQFAERLILGADDKVLSDRDYAIHPEDLNFECHFDDLSQIAQQYVASACLNTHPQARLDAANLLNEVLGESIRLTFQQNLFAGNNFQDLFKAIRTTLLQQGRTLVVLVEDMAAISAIEDVLIDSLLEESITDGNRLLCPLRSAIAVTDGYPGYKRRVSTIKTRAEFEWHILERSADDEATIQRIVQFCGRYLNAARHGRDELLRLRRDKSLTHWPPVWEAEEPDRDLVEAFGRTENAKIPLFPFNARSLRYLAERYCQPNGVLSFNPRTVLQNILLKFLDQGRIDFEHDAFPRADLLGKPAPVTLRTGLRELGLPEPVRAETLAAIWGFGSQDLNELRTVLPAGVAKAFGMLKLAEALGTPTPNHPPKTNPLGPPSRPQVPVPKVTDDPPPLNPADMRLQKVEQLANRWFAGTMLGQAEARILRAELALLFELHARPEWVGLKNRPSYGKIYLPNAQGNLAGEQVVRLCTDAEFSDPKGNLAFQKIALALLRHDHHQEEANPWGYVGGFEDYLTCLHFASWWVPATLERLALRERARLPFLLAEHVKEARTLGLLKEAAPLAEKQNQLLLRVEQIQPGLVPTACEAFKTSREAAMAVWDEKRSAWLDLVASNDHGMDGDLVARALKEAVKTPLHHTLQSVMVKIQNQLEGSNRVLQGVADCNDAEAFNRILADASRLVADLLTTGHYPEHNALSAHQLSTALKASLDAHCWTEVQRFRHLFNESNLLRKWELVNQIDGEKITTLCNVLSGLSQAFTQALPKLQLYNRDWGTSQLQEATDRVDGLINCLGENLTQIEEAVHEHN